MPLSFNPVKADESLRSLGIHADERDYRLDYPALADEIRNLTELGLSDELHRLMRKFAKDDLFFLGYFILDLPINHPFLIARCNEVHEDAHFTLDLWSREHFKSSIITFMKTIHDLIINPEERIGIFSFNRALAKGHMRRIKTALEQNMKLKRLFPEIFYMNPSAQAPKWSEDEGIYVKRKKVYNEASVEAWGLIESMPTGKHFTILVYDDIVTETTVSTTEQINKVEDRFKLSQNLGARGGKKRVVGTRYSTRDVYGTLVEAKRWKERIFPAEVDDQGMGKRGGTAVYLRPEELDEKFDGQGEYIYCLTGENRIMMGDYSHKPIKDIKQGEVVIGLLKGDLHSKADLVTTIVKKTWKYKLPCVELVLSNGQRIRCTREHKWWNGRWATDKDPNRKSYVPAGFGRGETSSLIQAFDFNRIDRDLSMEEIKAYFYLAGMFDADGSVSSNTITITQSLKVNKPVCDKIEKTLKTLGIDYGVYLKERPREDLSDVNMYYLKGGRQLAWEFLNITNPAKGWRIVKDLLHYASRLNSKGNKNRIKILEINDIGIQDVYAIETGTTNYIAEGFVSSNSCQMLQNPVAVSSQKLKTKWIKWYSKRPPAYFNKYLTVDPASAKKKSSDSTVMQVWGADPYKRLWLLDMIKDKMGLGEKWEMMKELTTKYEITDVGYEKYGMQADIEYFEEKMSEDSYYLNIIELGGTLSKEDRIKKLIPRLQKGRIILPRAMIYTDMEGKTSDIMVEFIEDEYKLFPSSKHDDMLDCMARILDAKMNIVYPIHKKAREQDIRNKKDPLNFKSQDEYEVVGWMGL